MKPHGTMEVEVYHRGDEGVFIVVIDDSHCAYVGYAEHPYEDMPVAHAKDLMRADIKALREGVWGPPTYG